MQNVQPNSSMAEAVKLLNIPAAVEQREIIATVEIERKEAVSDSMAGITREEVDRVKREGGNTLVEGLHIVRLQWQNFSLTLP